MRISKRGWRGVAVLAAISVGVAALIESGLLSDQQTLEVRFASSEAAHHAGLEALGRREMSKALPALQFAADRGVFGAQLRLARIYSGDGAHEDHAKAFTYYRMIVNKYGDIDELHPVSRHVAAALRNLSVYYSEGLAEIGLKADPQRAAQLMRDAASYFADPEAQFEIGKMYAEGEGVARSQRLAASWLLKASRKKYAPAQAYLGEMLWEADANDRLRAQGLALMSLALANAEPGQNKAIATRYRKIVRDANVSVIDRAERFVAALKSFGGEGSLRIATAKLRALRSKPPHEAPVGSFVVSADDEAFGGGDSAVNALMRDIRLYMPYDVVAKNTETEGFNDRLATHPMAKFVHGQPSLETVERSEDITTVEINRYSGETLSADAPGH